MNNITKLLIKKENDLYHAVTRISLLANPVVRVIIILVSIFLDAFTLYATFDAVLTQQVLLTWVITGGTALFLNLIPVLLADSLHNPAFSETNRRYIAWALAGTFLVMFLITFLLRLSTGQETFHPADDILLPTMESASDESLSMGEVMILILLGFEPLITSLFSFVLSYGVSLERKVAHIRALYMISLKDQLARECVKLCELRADMAFDHAAHDSKQLQALSNLLDAETEEVVVRSRRKLAEHEGSPEAVTYLLEGGYFQPSQPSQPQPEESCCGSTSKSLNDDQ